MIKIFAALMLVCSALTAKAADLRLTTKNTITFRGKVTDDSVAKAQRELFELAVKRGNAQYPLYLVLDTPGGDIGAGEDFIQFVRTIRDVETVTIFAASMGSAIAQGLPGKRHIVEHGTSMFHRARVGLSGQISDGEFESRLSMVKKHVQRLESRNAQRLSMGLSAYKAAVKDELWLVGSDAVVRKAADEVSTLHCSIELIQKTETVMMQVFIFSVEANFSACPLLRQGKVIEDADAALLRRYNQSIADKTYFRNQQQQTAAKEQNLERKIKQVRFYQAIEWEGAQTTFIRPDMSQMGGVRIHGSKHVDIKRTDDGVMLSSEKDCVEVFAANIAYIAYEMTAPKSTESAPATKSAKPDTSKSSKGA